MGNRKIFIGGNWKMNKGAGESLQFLDRVIKGIKADKYLMEAIPQRMTAVIFPQAANLFPMYETLKEYPLISLGVQNIHWENSGAFTGENSIAASLESGAGFALVGHSERRHIFGETDEVIGRKFRSCLGNGLKPVLCVGETGSERSRGNTETVIAHQVGSVLTDALENGKINELVIAYEPVWAIGTGNNATASDARECCGLIRETLCRIAGPESAENAYILYGGSVKSSNARIYLQEDGIDGLLVGGASLDPEEFLKILLTSLF
jgi:triosephosphate isomerase